MVAEKAKTMINCDEQREENFQEYLRLLSDPNYVDVCFDEQSGGVSAVHREHKHILCVVEESVIEWSP